MILCIFTHNVCISTCECTHAGPHVGHSLCMAFSGLRSMAFCRAGSSCSRKSLWVMCRSMEPLHSCEQSPHCHPEGVGSLSLSLTHTETHATHQDVLGRPALTHQDSLQVEIQQGTLGIENWAVGGVISHRLNECTPYRERGQYLTRTLCFSMVPMTFWAVQKSTHTPSRTSELWFWSRLSRVLRYCSARPGFWRTRNHVRGLSDHSAVVRPHPGTHSPLSING